MNLGFRRSTSSGALHDAGGATLMARNESLAVGARLLGLYFLITGLAQLGSLVHLYLTDVLGKYPGSRGGWSPVYNQVTYVAIVMVAGTILIVWSNRAFKGR